MGPIAESEIREALLHRLRSNGEVAGATIVQELALCRQQAFVDVALLSSEFHGFEIKSGFDSVARLNRQVRFYSAACDRCTVVVDRAHLSAVDAIVPPWWGIVSVQRIDDTLSLIDVRTAEPNPGVVVRDLTAMLRRSEIIRTLRANDPRARVSALSKDALVDRAIHWLGLDNARAVSIEILRTRKTWSIRQLGVASEGERLAIARAMPLPHLERLMTPLPLGAPA